MKYWTRYLWVAFVTFSVTITAFVACGLMLPKQNTGNNILDLPMLQNIDWRESLNQMKHADMGVDAFEHRQKIPFFLFS
jgi:hypothetical protein